MKTLSVAVQSRDEIGKGANRRLRSAGRIPAVIYGVGSEPQKVSLDSREFEKFVSGGEAQSTILSITGIGSGSAEENAAVVRELQRDPVTRRVLHADLYRIRMDVENDFEVAVHGVGIPIGVREGGILETHRRVLDIRCLPTRLPHFINVNLEGLKVNHSIHVADITAPEGVTIISGADEVLFTVLPPKQEVVAVAPVEGEEPVQPEVIGKKKAEEEGEEAPAAEKAKEKEKK